MGHMGIMWLSPLAFAGICLKLKKVPGEARFGRLGKSYQWIGREGRGDFSSPFPCPLGTREEPWRKR